jgi:hypothetical protein
MDSEINKIRNCNARPAAGVAAGQFRPQGYGDKRKKSRRKVALPPAKIF